MRATYCRVRTMEASMSKPVKMIFESADLQDIKSAAGVLVVFATPEGKLDALGRKVNSATKKSLQRFRDCIIFPFLF